MTMAEERPALQPGLEAEYAVTATSEAVASRFGNVDVDVVATPYLIWLLEGASVRAVKDHLAPSERTVGTAVNVRHQRAAPAGVEITVRARLIEVEGRRLVFEVEALARGERLMSGRHERMVVEVERFLQRAKRERSAES